MDSTKTQMKSMMMNDEFKKYSTINEFITDKIKESAEFNKKQLQIIYKSLKAALKTKIFGNLEQIQRNLEDTMREMFSEDCGSFRKYKRLASSLETRITEITSLQKESECKDVFIFTRLSKLQGDLKELKKADVIFKSFQETALAFNVETELNFQLFQDIIQFRNKVIEVNKIESHKNKIEMLFEKRDETKVSKKPILNVLESDRSITPRIDRKINMLSSNQKMGSQISRNHSMLSVSDSPSDFVSALAFIEAKHDKNLKSRGNPNAISENFKNKSLFNPRESAITVQPRLQQELTGLKRRPSFFEKSFRKGVESMKEIGDLFTVHNNAAIVTKLNIDFASFSHLLERICESESIIRQIVFINNVFLENPLKCLLSLFEGPLNDGLKIDLRKNKFAEGILFRKEDIQMLENLNIFVSV